jgi:DNA replication protein DnaC
MDKPKTLEEANALLLQRRAALEEKRQKEGTPAPLVSSPSLYSFKPLSPEEAAQAEERAAAWEREREEHEAAERARKAEEGRKRRLARARIPDRHENRELKPVPEWSAVLESLTKNLGRGILVALLGLRGTGKTQIAVEAIRETINRGGEARYVKALDLIIRFREAFRKDGPSERAVLEEFLEPDLLVIDAMEERGETEFEDRMISHLIDRRYDALGDTILISNQTKDAFSKAIGLSATSRIIETGKVFECAWESFRKKPEPAAARNSSLPVGDRS